MNKVLVSAVLIVLVGGGALFVFTRSGSGPKSTMEKAETVSTREGSAGDMQKDKMASTSDEVMKKSGNTMMSAGSYEVYAPSKLAKADSGHVVLFFRASWCPICRSLDADIRAHLSNIPKDLTILDVDYDNSSALKQKYGVTYQHTFVQVKADGTLIKKWSGSPTLAALVSEVQ